MNKNNNTASYKNDLLPDSDSLKSTTTSPNKIVFSNTDHKVKLYQANCLEFMDLLLSDFPELKFDMIFADPPYFLSNGGITCHAGKMVKVDKGKWDKSEGPVINHRFNLEWLRRCRDLLTDNGTIWVSGTSHVIFSVGYAMQELGMKILNDIIWEKPNPPPNLACRYFTHSTETVIWAAKNLKSKHFFNYKLMKSMNGGKQMKSVWTMQAPRKAEKAHGRHPTQKPEELLDRIILCSTSTGDLVFDPFSGSCTTGVTAVKNERQFIGCELESEFLDIAVNRLRQAIEDKKQVEIPI